MPMVVAKRNARERTRVHTVNQAFLVLKQHLPSLRQFTKRVSKLRILNAAINYIDALLKLIQSSEAVPQSAFSATLGPVAPNSLRVLQKGSKPDPFIMRQSVHTLPPIAQCKDAHALASVATCSPDRSLVDYKSTLSTSFTPVHVHMQTVFSPQPTFPYMKSLLDYPTYFYQPPTASMPGPAPQMAQSHLIVNNQISPMPSYQCF